MAAHDHLLERITRIPRPVAEVFPFFADARNLARITPPRMGFQILSTHPLEMRRNLMIDYHLRVAGIRLRWRSLITVWQPPDRFVDEQIAGPYARWTHLHEFHADGQTTVMRDVVRYRLPFGILGNLGLPFVKRQLEHIFDYRESAIQYLLNSPTVPR